MQPRLILKQRILIADYDNHFARRLSEYFWDHGYEARVVHTVAEARSAIVSWQPQSLFVNLMLPETNAISLIRFVYSDSVRIKPEITVMAKHSATGALDQVRRAGAMYTLLKPFPLEDALKIAEMGSRDTSSYSDKKAPDSGSMRELYLLNLILRQATAGDDNARLFKLLNMINLKVNAMRSSVIQWINPEFAVVLASNDDENVRGLPLRLKDYPEIETVRVTGRTLVIPNVRTSDILAPIQNKISQTPFESIVLFPVLKQGEFFGVLSLRMEQKEATDLFYIEKFGEVCSHILALSLIHPEQAL